MFTSSNADINVRPHPPVGHRVRLTESIDIKLRPRGGILLCMRQRMQKGKCVFMHKHALLFLCKLGCSYASSSGDLT